MALIRPPCIHINRRLIQSALGQPVAWHHSPLRISGVMSLTWPLFPEPFRTGLLSKGSLGQHSPGPQSWSLWGFWNRKSFVTTSIVLIPIAYCSQNKIFRNSYCSQNKRILKIGAFVNRTLSLHIILLTALLGKYLVKMTWHERKGGQNGCQSPRVASTGNGVMDTFARFYFNTFRSTSNCRPLAFFLNAASWTFG